MKAKHEGWSRKREQPLHSEGLNLIHICIEVGITAYAAHFETEFMRMSTVSGRAFCFVSLRHASNPHLLLVFLLQGIYYLYKGLKNIKAEMAA